MLGQRADAEDVAQEVIIRYLKHRWRLQLSRNIPGWIHRVTVNCCMDVLRVRESQLAVDISAIQSPATAHEHLDLPMILSRLSARERVAVALVFGQGMSCVEAGRAMGCKSGTVRVLCHRARNKMKPMLNEQQA